MRKIDLSDYLVGDVPFQVRPSLAVILFNGKTIDARELIKRDTLATRIEQTVGDVLLLEDTDYQKVVDSLNATDLQPYGRTAVEFVKRILDAPTVEVQEK